MKYEVITPAPESAVARTEMVRMRDGVSLASDVYLTENVPQPAPTVLIRLPYDKNGAYCFIEDVAQRFTAAGYHVVAQDVRGKFRSEGETQLFVNEALDGHDTISWIERQSWSDGSVVMWGESYFGFTQWAAASTGHPALKAIAPRMTETMLIEPQRDAPGVLERPVENAETYVYPITHFNRRDTFLWEPTWSTHPFIDELEAFQSELGFRSESFDQRYPHPSFLRRFPEGHPFDAPAIPCLMTIGWWDNIAPGSWRDWRALKREHPQWHPNLYLFIDAIDHENFRFGEQYSSLERTSDEIAALLPELVQPAIEFFDLFVKHRGDPDDLPRVRWNLAGTDTWRASASWPPEGAVTSKLHLAADGTLRASDAAEIAELQWVHDPADPVPSSAENPFAYLVDLPDESERSSRSDVLVFTAPALKGPMILAGSVSLRATVGSTARSMDLFAWLLDVAPDGSAVRIARGNTHLNALDADREVVVDLFEAGYRIAAGHALQVQLASSDFPEFLLHPGHEGDPLAAVETQHNTQHIMVGGPHGAVLSFTSLEDAE